jgi:glutamate dehydrogenase/leucine dehydrogenase
MNQSFLTSRYEVAETVILLLKKIKIQNKMLLERMLSVVIIMFRVTWVDDAGKLKLTGYRIQMNSANRTI